MRNIVYVLLLAGISILMGCNKDEVKSPTNNKTENIQFDQLAVGQQNTYLGYKGEGYYKSDSHDDFEYLKDTLIVRIIEQNGAFFKVEEFLTTGSESLQGDQGEWYGDTLLYEISVAENELVVKSEMAYGHSYLIPQFSLGTWGSEQNEPVKFPLEEFTMNETEIKGWKTTGPFEESYMESFAQSCEILGVQYGRVNVIVDNVPMQVDGNGNTYVYSRSKGFVRTINYSAWTGAGRGWDLF